MKQHIKHSGITVCVLLLLLIIGGGYFVYSGVYNIGADDPHTKPVYTLLEILRNRSISVRAESLTVPNLDDPQLISRGAGQYAAMCIGCHLAPGGKDSEIRPGLYPQPPDLTKARVEPKAAFWVIKHGIKMSAMPAWGGSHDDETIWSMVAFLQKLPDMTPSQYKEIVAKAPPDDDMAPMAPSAGAGHSHGHSEHSHSAPTPPSDQPNDEAPSAHQGQSHTHGGDDQ
ncbi:MAG: cytochrome c [Beijerinckiaceae bacterium]|nr:MAG: cytochrome c [Beijerinckiaceae bacterium]